MAAHASQLVLCCLPASPPRQTYVDSPLPEHVIIDNLEAVLRLAQVLAGRAKGKAPFSLAKRLASAQASRGC